MATFTTVVREHKTIVAVFIRLVVFFLLSVVLSLEARMANNVMFAVYRIRNNLVN